MPRAMLPVPMIVTSIAGSLRRGGTPHHRASTAPAPWQGLVDAWTSRRSDRHDAVALPRPLDALALGELERADDRRARLARVDHVVDHVVASRDVHVDQLAVGLDQLGLL